MTSNRLPGPVGRWAGVQAISGPQLSRVSSTRSLRRDASAGFPSAAANDFLAAVSSRSRCGGGIKASAASRNPRGGKRNCNVSARGRSECSAGGQWGRGGGGKHSASLQHTDALQPDGVITMVSWEASGGEGWGVGECVYAGVPLTQVAHVSMPLWLPAGQPPSTCTAHTCDVILTRYDVISDRGGGSTACHISMVWHRSFLEIDKGRAKFNQSLKENLKTVLYGRALGHLDRLFRCLWQ